MADRRPHILVLNQYYKPGVEATANLLADLCESLAEEFDVTVVTGRLQGRAELPSEEVLNDVRVLRTRSTAFDRTKLRFRTLNYITYLLDSLVRARSVARPDLVLCMTDPPIVGDLGLLIARRRGVPLLVISEDVFPEIATELGRLTNPLVIAPLRALVGFYLRRADTVVAIGERMRERLIAKGAPPERVIVIPNWVDTASITPQPKQNEWSREAGLDGRFVVMHSGNVGHAQNLDKLIVATTHLRDLDELSVPIIGFGARSRELEQLTKRARGGPRALPRVSAARAPQRVALRRGRPLRRPGARALGLRRPEPPLRDPLGRSPRHRRGGRGQRDGGARE